MTILAALALLAFGNDGPTFEVREIEGWQVHVNEQALAEHPEPMNDALEHLRWQLYATALTLPEATLAKAREVPIWAEYETKTACMSFHPARKWLTDRGYEPPELPSMVELANAHSFLAWTHHQPWMVLHELAHGLDFITIGNRQRYGEPTFDALWKEVEAGGKYESIRHWQGHESKHYALNNPMELFAESTEAYFGINDFYPFVRAELRDFDPATTTAIRERWGVDVEAEEALEARLAAALEWDAGSAAIEGGASGTVDYVDIDGWRVMLRHELVDGPLRSPLLEAIGHELHLAGRYLPAPIFEDLREALRHDGIRVYPRDSTFRYVDSRQPGILIGKARNFLDFKTLEPCIMIRELAGCWYDLELDEDPAIVKAVLAALHRARASGLYDSVLRFDGRRVRHPALRDARTFFAELSESYFLGNDHFPFVRAELMNHDRESFELIESLWQKRQKR